MFIFMKTIVLLAGCINAFLLRVLGCYDPIVSACVLIVCIEHL